MDKRKKHPGIKASDFGKSHEDLLKSFVQKNTPETIQLLQKRSNETLKQIVKKKRISEKDIIKGDIHLRDTNGGNFGVIDEVSKDGIGKVKVVSAADFENIIVSKGLKQDKSELNALMHNSKIKKGYLHYVNQDNPYMQATIRQKYDVDKYTQDLNKVKRVQSFIEKKQLPVFDNSTSRFMALKESDYPEDYARLQELKSQSIAHDGMKSNNPFIRNMRREARPVIEGMGHGWFGKMRKLITPFGSSMRFADVIALQQAAVDKAFDGQWGIDIETKSLKSQKHSIFQISLKRGEDYHSIFLQQAKEFQLEKHPFLYDHTAIGKIHKKSPLDFTKVQQLPGYQQDLRNTQSGFAGNVHAEIVKRDQARRYTEEFMKEAKDQKKNVFAMNANFEIDHFSDLFEAANPVQYTQEYVQLRSELSMSNKSILGKVKRKEITEAEGFSQMVSNQKIKYAHIMSEAMEQKGAIIEIQEMTKTLNAIAQEKGLIAKTGRFGVGTNINFLADAFLDEGEWHDGNLDNFQQGRVAKKVQQAIQDLESGTMNEDTRRWLTTRTSNEVGLYEESMYRMIKNQTETGGSLADINPQYNRDRRLLSNAAINEEDVYNRMSKKYLVSEEYQTFMRSNEAIGGGITGRQANAVEKLRKGSLLLGGILLGSAMTNMFRFSGSDDSANTIEGLGHGSPTQDQRQYTTSFGSGFRSEKFDKAPQGQEEQEGMSWTQLGLTGMGAVTAYQVFKHQASKRRLNDVTYLGALADGMDNETLLGRTDARAQDLAVAAIRRAENMLGHFPKAFGVGDLASIGMYDSAKFEVDFRTPDGETYAKYMDKAFKRKFIEEGIHKVTFENGKLLLHKGGQVEEMKGTFSLMKTVTDYNQTRNVSSLATSHLQQLGIKNINAYKTTPFLITNGVDHFASAFAHETVAKTMKMMADPFEGLRQFFPKIDDYASPWIKKVLGPQGIAKYLDLGLQGEELADTTTGMLKKHGVKLGTLGALAYFGLGTLNWAVKEVTPDGTPLGDAGILGGAAYTIRKGHELYARMSDMTGMTALRDYVENKAPGSEGWQSTVGLTLAGAMAGGLFGSVEDVTLEATAPNKYAQFLKNAEETESIDGMAGRVFKGKYTKTGKKTRLGAALGFALALPFTIAGFGAESSASELAAEYSGEKEVAVKKGRFWEASFTPWEGGEIDYYRPNWYAKLMDDAKTETLYGEDLSPFTKAAKSLVDPYWLEKKRYFNQPYPVTGPDGSMMGIFGPIYEATLGRVLKPVATMHGSLYPEELLNNTEYDMDAMLRKQWNASLEFMGLRGFATKAIKGTLTGDPEINSDPNEARSAKDIDSVVRDFYDLQIGGGMLTTEALRRVFQSQEGFQKAQIDASINLNPVKNTMPNWMPGSDFHNDFQHGDPFLKVKDGYYRLPGEGYATRYEDLKGVDPSDYPDIYRYKILSDVAYGSMQHRAVKGKLQNRQLTQYEQDIFDEVQRQVDEKKKSELNVRDPNTYDSFLGRYSAMLTDLARSNPLETLLPISPAHKFLAPPDVEDVMEERMYSKDYRDWANPIDDFILPTVSMTMNSLGLGGISMANDEEEAANYFDKANYVKFSNLANEARAQGDLRSADKYTLMAQKTYTGKDLYSHAANVAGSLPRSERSFYNHFVGSDRDTQERMIGKTNPRYRDAYQAQMDKQLRQEAATSRRMNAQQRRKVMNDINKRQQQIKARRQAEVQDFQERMPDSQWAGWNNSVDLGAVQQRYVENRARDYHGYSGRREARNDTAIASAASINIDNGSLVSYDSHYKELANSGIENALVVIRPGLDNEANINVTVDRTDDRDKALQEWGYVV